MRGSFAIGWWPLASTRAGTARTLSVVQASEIYRETGNPCAVQLLRSRSKDNSTRGYLGVEREDALRIAERIDI